MKTYLQTIYQEIISKEQWADKYKQSVPVDPNVYKDAAPHLKQLFTKLNGGTFSPVVVMDFNGFIKRIGVIDKRLMALLKKAGYNINASLYKLGIAIKDGKEKSIQSIIDSFKSKNIEQMKQKYEQTNNEAIKKQLDLIYDFTKKIPINDLALPVGKGRYKLVFSMNFRHIASQSTGVGWTSCMFLGNDEKASGMYSQMVGPGIAAGSFIVFITKVGDENELEHPSARVLCKPYVGKHSGKWIWKPDKAYGDPPQGFSDVVDKILRKHMSISSDDYHLREPDPDEQSHYLDLLNTKYSIFSTADARLVNKFINLSADIPEHRKELETFNRFSLAKQLMILNYSDWIADNVLKALDNPREEVIRTYLGIKIVDGDVEGRNQKATLTEFMQYAKNVKMTKEIINDYVVYNRTDETLHEAIKLFPELIDKSIVLNGLRETSTNSNKFIKYVKQYNISFYELYKAAEYNYRGNLFKYFSLNFLKQYKKEINELNDVNLALLIKKVDTWPEQLLDNNIITKERFKKLLRGEDISVLGYFGKEENIQKYLDDDDIKNIIENNLDNSSVLQLMPNDFVFNYLKENVASLRGRDIKNILSAVSSRLTVEACRALIKELFHKKTVDGNQFSQKIAIENYDTMLFQLYDIDTLNENDIIQYIDWRKELDEETSSFMTTQLSTILSSLQLPDEKMFSILNALPNFAKHISGDFYTIKNLDYAIKNDLMPIDKLIKSFLLYCLGSEEKKMRSYLYNLLFELPKEKIRNILTAQNKIIIETISHNLSYEQRLKLLNDDTMFDLMFVDSNYPAFIIHRQAILNDFENITIPNEIQIKLIKEATNEEHKTIDIIQGITRLQEPDFDVINDYILTNKDYIKHIHRFYTYHLAKNTKNPDDATKEQLLKILRHATSSNIIEDILSVKYTKEEYLKIHKIIEEKHTQDGLPKNLCITGYIEPIIAQFLIDNMAYTLSLKGLGEKTLASLFEKFNYFNDKDIMKSIPFPPKDILKSLAFKDNNAHEMMSYVYKKHKLIV